jgi:hypothetical protein
MKGGNYMAVQDVLSARLEVKDSFTSKLSTFITKTIMQKRHLKSL